MWDLARRAGLDENSPYCYLLWGHHHPDTTMVAETSGGLVGFVHSYEIPSTSALFVWQIGVDPEAQGAGIASRLLDTLAIERCPDALEATVTPSNSGSDALFRSFARRHHGALAVAPCFAADQFPGDHEPELLYRIDLQAARSAGRSHSRGENYLGAL